MLEAALRYLEIGLCPVLPLAGKRPVPHLVPRGLLHATTSADVARGWWSEADYNIGGAVPPGVAVLDVDPRNSGHEHLADLVLQNGPLPLTLRCDTGGGGFHLWYRVDGRPLKSFLRGVDLKRHGGYVVLPPSVHPTTGQPYRWSNREPIVPMPEWRLQTLTSPGGQHKSRSRTPRKSYRGELSPLAWRMLRTGDKDYGDTTASGVFWSCLWFLANAGWSPASALQLASLPSYPGLHRELLKRGPRHFEQQYERAITMSGRGGSTTAVDKLRQLVVAVEVAAAAGMWRGREGDNDRTALELILRQAVEAHRTTLSYSSLQLMREASSTRRQTAASVMQRLVDKGWLVKIAGPRGRTPSTYALRVPRQVRSLPEYSWSLARASSEDVSRLTDLNRRVPLSADAFAFGGGVNKGGAIVLRALLTLADAAPSSPGAKELEKKGTVETHEISRSTGKSEWRPPGWCATGTVTPGGVP